MKTSIISCALLICATALTAQNKNTNEGEKKMTVRIKKVENINGVETIKDTTYTTTQAAWVENEGGDVKIIKMDGDKKCDAKKMVIINSDNGQAGMQDIKITSGEIDAEVEKALKDEGIDPAKMKSNMYQTIVVDTDAKDGKSGEKKITRISILREVKIVTATEDDMKMVSKQTGVTDNKLSVNDMNFYPNPGNGKFNLSFKLEEKGNTQITILNVEGKVIYTEKLNDFSGVYDKEIDISKNPKGVYFVRVEQGAHSQLKKIILE